MIKELTWDTELLDKKIGRLSLQSGQLVDLGSLIIKAEAQGFRYLTCRMRSQDSTIIRLLESSGFYLSDIGVIFTLKLADFHIRNRSHGDIIFVAASEDIPMLQKTAKSLFLHSRFYHDPFYSKEEANRIFQAWIENSVRGNGADVVFHIRNTGFITCRKNVRGTGEIILVGIKKSERAKGFGTALITAALDWFLSQGISTVSVRTQLRNINSIRFYQNLGFYIQGYDLIFGRILKTYNYPMKKNQ